MPRDIYLVKVGMSMTEGMVAEWYVPDGGQVKKGELVYALETEKVNLDVDAEYDGTVKHLVDVGVMLEPGAVVGYIFESGESVPSQLTGAPEKAAAGTEAVTQQEASPVAASAAPSEQTRTPGERIKSSPAARRLAKELGIDYASLLGTGPGGRIVEADILAASAGAAVPSQAAAPKASPLAKRLAKEMGVALARVQGTGPGGRIVQADIEAAAKGTTPAASPPATGRAAAAQPAPISPGQKVPVKGMRKTIATRMHQSLMEAAQLTMNMEALMDDAVKLRNGLVAEWEGEGIRPTYTDLVLKAAAKALRTHPMMNSQFTADGITLLEEVNLGVAVALPEGLVVPVIRGADSLPLKALAAESARLAAAARAGNLGLDDYAGGTFTVSALGMYGVDSFTPIINQPQAGILGVNRLYDGLEWQEDTPKKVKKMNLSLTWDHRTLDGAPAAEFLLEVKQLLEAPYRLLV